MLELELVTQRQVHGPLGYHLSPKGPITIWSAKNNHSGTALMVCAQSRRALEGSSHRTTGDKLECCTHLEELQNNTTSTCEIF